MSKQGKRKITVDLQKTKELAVRPSVFERLGTKKSSAKKTNEHCRQWAQHGTCAYGKSCKFASTHTLVSPSKQRAANKDSESKRSLKDDSASRLHSTVVVRSGRSPEGEIDNWDQNDLEFADTDVLEKRRQQLQRELELQLKMDCNKDGRKDKKKPSSSSSSTLSSSSSSVTSSTSDGSSSSSSSDRGAKRKGKKGKLKRNSSSSSDGDVPTKKKYSKGDSLKQGRSATSNSTVKKDDRLQKRNSSVKKKLTKSTLGKKSLSPGKKSGGTPPINIRNTSKLYSGSKTGKSPLRRDKNRSTSPTSLKDRDKERDRAKDREKDKDRDKDRDRTRGRSKSVRKGRSRSPRGHGSHSKDPRRKDSAERSRPVSPKKRREGSSDKYKKRSGSRDRDRNRDYKDRSLERRKYDDKDRHDRKDRLDRGRDRTKERGLDKRDDKRAKGRGLGRSAADKGLEKPNKPMERLLPRPEERMAALAAITNRNLDIDKVSTNSKERQDSERGGRKQDRNERDRSSKRDRLDSLDRDRGDYDNVDRQYEHGRAVDRYDRVDDHYNEVARDDNRSPGYNRERRYDPGYDLPGARTYPEDEDRLYGEHDRERRGVDMRYDEHRTHRDHSWEGRSTSRDRERAYIHPHKEWEGEDYRAGGEWGRERHWPLHDTQMADWGDKEANMDSWHHRGHPPGPHRPRGHEDYNRGMRMDVGKADNSKRRPQRTETEPVKDAPSVVPPQPAPVTVTRVETEGDDNPIPDDLSEISDDPDDILNREDMVEQNIMDDESEAAPSTEDNLNKTELSENQSTQDVSGAAEEKESQEAKDEDDMTNLDFEEISDGELEEERTRAGLGDALGVDWASLAKEVRRREQTAPVTGVRDRWRPEFVLTRIGISVKMAGRPLVQSILEKYAESCKADKEKKKAASEVNEEEKEESSTQNGEQEAQDEEDALPTVDTIHPIAAIQVAIERSKRLRAELFGTGCEFTPALCARRDLALRRHLCHLPPTEGSGQFRITPQPALYNEARALLMDMDNMASG